RSRAPPRPGTDTPRADREAPCAARSSSPEPRRRRFSPALAPSSPSVRAPVAIHGDQRVHDAANEREPQELAEPRVPHAAPRHDQEEGQRDRAIEEAAMAVAEAVQRDAVFTVQAQAEVT